MSELKVYHCNEWHNEYTEFYLKSEVDAIIAKLENKCKTYDLFWEQCGFKKQGFMNTIAVSKTLNKGAYHVFEHIAENAELKQKLEDVKATAYTESVDAGMENRKLKRALWLARAEWASDKARIFYFAYTCGVMLNIDGYSNKEKGRTRMDTARWWRLTWLKVERKCRAKAEKYK